MAASKITEKEVGQLKDNSHILVTQPEATTVDGEEVSVESLRRIAITDLIAKIKLLGGIIDNNNISELSSEIVSNVEKTDSGIKITWKDGNTEEFTVESGGLSFDSGYQDEEGYVHLTRDGEDIEGFDPFKIAGGGGGGSSSGSKITFAMYTPTALSILDTATTALISFKLTSVDVETQVPTGALTVSVSVNGVVRETKPVAQGDASIDVLMHLNVGSNAIKLVATDSYGASVTRNLTITKESFKLEWNLGNTELSTGDITVAITPTAVGSKTIRLLIDGELYSTDIVNTSGRRITKTLNLSTGRHTVEAYGELVVNGMVLESNHLKSCIAQVTESSTNPVVVAMIQKTTVNQYDTVSIAYRVIDPSNNPATVKLYVGNTLYNTIECDQSEKTWDYKTTTSGNVSFRISCGSDVWAGNVEVESIGAEISEVTDRLAVKVNPSEITDLTTFSNNGHTFAFSEGFDHINGGLQTDPEGVRCIKVMKGDRLTLNYKPFENDFRRTGAEFKFIYKILNSTDFYATAIECYNGGVGLRIRANDVLFNSEQTSDSFLSCEDYKTELDINISSDAEDRMIMFWESCSPCNPALYAANDNFSQPSGKNIVIGSDDCDVYLYLIKCYTRSLTKEEIKANYIADGKDGTEIMERYERNQIYDSTGNIDVDRVAELNPNIHVLTWHAPKFSLAKSEKITGTLTHKCISKGPEHTWTATNVSEKVQGTSSLDYAKDAGGNADFDITKGTITLEDGTVLSDGYSMSDDAIPVKYFNFKANVASQEHANNIIIADWFNSNQPDRRDAKDTQGVRDTIQGEMAVLFFHNTSDTVVDIGSDTVQPDETIFYSLGNLCNSKKNTDVFGQNGDDDILCVEFRNNTSDQTRFKSDDLEEEDFSGDYNFELRYIHSSLTNAAAKEMLQEVLSFVVSCDAENATDEPLSDPETVGDQIYYIDSADYRIAKFREGFDDYFVSDSICFHKNMTLALSMCDNRAKNMFLGYSNKRKKWHLDFDYDNDTALGIDNEGSLSLRYGYMDTDFIGTKSVFNAHDNTLFRMLDIAFPERLEAMYSTMQNSGAMDFERLGNIFDAYQNNICESLWIEDAYRKSIHTYTVMGTDSYLDMMNGKKRLQRRNFLKFQKPFIDSYFLGASSIADSATIRGYTPTAWQGVKPESKMTITPYSDIFVQVLAGSIKSKVRAYAGQQVTLNLGVNSMNDTEVYVRNCSLMQSLGPLAQLYPGYCNFALMKKLRRSEIGSSEQGYTNTNFSGASYTNCESLEYVNHMNCPNDEESLDFSPNINLKELYTEGTNVTGVKFAKNGRIETAHLNGITSLYASNLAWLNDLTIDKFDKLSSIVIEDCTTIDSYEIVKSASNVLRLRLLDVSWDVDQNAYYLLKKIQQTGGIDDNGYNLENAVISGSVHFTEITPTKFYELDDAELFNNVEFSYDDFLDEYYVTFVDATGEINLCTLVTESGGSVVNPIEAGIIPVPTKEKSVEKEYVFTGWDTNLDYIVGTCVVNPMFDEVDRYYTVKHLNTDGTVLQEVRVTAHSNVAYTGPEPERPGYVWDGWQKEVTNVVADENVYATYITPVLPSEIKDMSQYDYAYSDFESDNSAYTFAELYAIVKTGQALKYMNIGSKIKIRNIGVAVTDASIVFSLHSVGHYELADGSGKMSNADWYMTGTFANNYRVNATITTNGGWDASELRSKLNNTIYPSLQPKWRSFISKSITLASVGGGSTQIQSSEDYLRIPSVLEVGYGVGEIPYINEVSERANEGAFQVYTSNSSRIKKKPNGNTDWYWLRSAWAGSSSAFAGIGNYGTLSSTNATNIAGVCAGLSS